jgi:L-lysine 6-transaminase
MAIRAPSRDECDIPSVFEQSESRMRLIPTDVHGTLKRSILVEGYSFVLDLEKSHGQYLHDQITGTDYLDFFTFYASRPIRFDHPKLHEEEYLKRLALASRCKPSNGDIYTTFFAEFVETFRTTALGPGMHYLFFIDSGTLAVENALKTAFDWKVQKNLEAKKGEKGTQVIHFEHAFHGRSGYCLSITNTSDPRKVRYFPKFPWPRISSPAVRYPIDARSTQEAAADEEVALRQIEEAYERHGDDIACIIIEPIQCEGGDRHFRPSFLQKLRRICDDKGSLLVFDEVQTGMGSTGSWWYYEQVGVTPDIVAFAKKAQTGGIMASTKLDEVDSVFQVKSRISSTFGGNLVDFVRSTRYLEIVKEENLLENARKEGAFLKEGLETIAQKHEGMTNVRGLGLILAFDLEDGTARDRTIVRAQQEGLLVLPCGDRSVRLRPALDVQRRDSETALAMLDRALAVVLNAR